MNNDLLDICNQLVSLGLKAGADEIEVFAASQRSIEAAIEGNEVKMGRSGESAGIGVRVFRNKSLGFSSTNSLDKERLEKTVKTAIKLSKNSPPDINNALPDTSEFGFVTGLYDQEIADLDEQEVIERANRMLISAKGIDERIAVDAGRFESIVGKKGLSNSNGISVDERFTGIYYDIGAHAVDNGVVSPMDYRFDGARILRMDRSEEISIELAETVAGAMKTEKVKSFFGPVLFSPLAAIDVLLAPVLFSADSDNVQKGTSRYTGRKGDFVASPLLTVIDDGTTPSGLSSSSFDREGVPHRRLEIIDNGRMRNFLYSSYTANKDGVESTGNASGGTRHVPMIDSTNIEVKGGDRSFESMVAEMDRGLLVHRLSGNIDPISGDFSGVAKLGKRIDKGEVGGFIRETMISGNSYNILSRLRGISKERERIMDFRLPFFIADDVSITGG